MSRYSSNQTKKSTASQCAHCRNLGLDTNHALRSSADPTSAVVCPVLLKTECKYCFKLGHTTSHCAAAKKNASSKIVHTRPIVLVPVPVLSKPATSTKAKSANLFNCLMEDEEDIPKKRGEKRKMKQEEFPVLMHEETSQSAPSSFGSSMSFAQALAKPVALKIQSSPPLPTSTTSTTSISSLPIAVSRPKIVYQFIKNWADYETDEE